MHALLLLTALAAAAPEPELRWGADAQGGAPYVFQDPTDPNHLIGFEVELAGALGKKLGLRARPIQGPWDKLLELLERGDFDLALNGIEVAAEKKRVALLSRPYFSAPERLTIRRGDANAPRTLEALKGRQVGTLPGSMAERILTRAGAEVRTYEGGQDEIYADLKLGRTDAVLLDAPIAIFYAEIDSDFENVPGEFGSVEYAVAFRLGDEERQAQVNAALEALIRDGTLRALYERWGLWSPEVARLLGDPDLKPRSPPEELMRWRAAVGKLPPFWERVRTRYPQVLPLFLKGAGLSLAVSLLAMVLAIVLGVALAMGRRYGPTVVSVACVAYIEFFRGTPLLIQLTMVYFGLPELGVKLSPFVAGVVALGLNYAAAEAENYRAGLESVPAGQLEAATVLGFSRLQSLRFIVAPQAVRIAIPPMTNDFIALLKDSSLVSIVTLTELTKTYTTLASSMRDHLGLGLLVALVYLLIGLPFAQLARVVERRFARHLKRGLA
ncbi:MAG: Amino acid transporter binding protein and permease protein [Myxococcaceae bacterium]|nr:Amino acid transporter binding protein and permease protein [Myxococcaceae bacterium]